MFSEDMIDMGDGYGGFKPVSEKKKLKKKKHHKEETVESTRHESQEEKKQDNKDTTSMIKRMVPPPPPPPPPVHQDQTIPIQRVLPWRRNGSRTVATAGAPAYYGVYLDSVNITKDKISLHLLAMGEWNLSSPATSLFCVLELDRESWQVLAERERRQFQSKTCGDSRFDRAEWKPQIESRGFYQGTLVLPRSFLRTPRTGHTTCTTTRWTLAMRFASSTPWQTDYAIVNLFHFTSDNHFQACPQHKLPVFPHDPWSPIFPRHVIQRFQARETTSHSQPQQIQQ